MATGGVLGRAFIQVFADLSKFNGSLKKELDKSLDETAKHVDFDPLKQAGERAGEDVGSEIVKGTEKALDKKGKPAMEKRGAALGDSLIKGILPALGRIGPSLLPILIALGLELAGALLPAVTALTAAIPGAIAMAAASAITLKVAFKGVGAAIGAAFAGNPQKLALAMAKLAPAARGFVMEIAKLKPELHAIQQGVQQAFFLQLEGSLTRTAKVLLPAVSVGMQALSRDLGKVGKGLIDSLGSTGGVASISAIFANADTAIKPLIPALGKMVGAFLTLGAASGRFFATLSNGLGGVLSKFSTWVANAAASGALDRMFNAGITALKLLGGLLGVVWDLVRGLLSALSTAGGSGFGIIVSLLRVLADFVNSPAGQGALVGIFNALNAVISALSPVLGALLPGVATLIGLLSPAFVKIMNDLAPAFKNIAKGISDALPVLGPFVDLIVKIVDKAAPFLDWLTRQPGLIQLIVDAWLGYRAALIAVAIWEGIVDALDPATWVVLAVVAIGAAAYEIVQHWSAIVGFFKSIGSAIAGFFVWIWHVMVDVFNRVKVFVTETIPGWFEALPGRIWAFIQTIPGILDGIFHEALRLAGEAVGIGVGLLLAAILILPGKIWDGLKGLVSLIGGLFHDAWTWALNEWIRYYNWFSNELLTLPGKIEAWLDSLPARLGAIFRKAWQWVKDEFAKAGDWIVQFAKDLPGRIVGFFSGVGNSVYQGIKSGINSAIDGFNAGIDKVAGPLHIGLPHIPRLATGGLITSPTLAVVGEAGTEAVIPMSDPQKAVRAAQQTGLLDMLSGMMGAAKQGAVNVRVFLGTRELEDIVIEVVDSAFGASSAALASGPR